MIRIQNAALFALVFSFAGPATAAQAMRISTTEPENSHYGVLINTFATEVQSRTDGRYKIDAFFSGSLGGEREGTEAVQMGTQELALSSTGPIPNFVPEVAILDVPFLFRDYAHARAVLDGPIGERLLQKFEPKGIKALGWCDNGFRHMTNNRRPVNAVGDLQGLKLRTMENPVHIEAFKAFGIIPTPMSFTEVYTSLQQGTVDGLEAPLTVLQANRLEQVQKYMTLTGHVFSPCALMMNKQAFDRLPPKDQAAFQEAAKLAIAANRARVDQVEREAVAYFRDKGMEVQTEVDKAPYQAALGPVYERFAKRFGEKELAEIRDAR